MERKFLLLLLLMVSCSQFDLADYSNSKEAGEQGEELLNMSQKTADIYYYYFDTKVFLKEQQDLFLVCFNDAQARRDYIAELNSVSLLKIWNPNGSNTDIEDDPYNFLILQSLDPNLKYDLIKETLTRSDIKYVSPIYGDDNTCLTAVTDEFSVQLKNKADLSRLVEMAAKFDCSVVRRDDFDDGVYDVRLQKQNEAGAVRLSAMFYESGLFVFTSPAFVWFGGIASTDTYYSDQWGLKNTGQYFNSGPDINIESAWSITEGDNDIIIAILDSGVELTHPDLSGNLVAGYDAISNTPGGAPQESGASHGTAVAGVAGAIKNNGIGISGVAPNCKIMPIRVAYYSSTYGREIVDVNAAVFGFNWARTHGADVINCSWGGPTPSGPLTTAINNATSLGRDGKGCVVICSSGNTENADNGSVSYPGYLDNVMAVGAISINGKRKNLTTPDNENWSSNYGPTLDVVAPGVFISTTDLSGSQGINEQRLSILNKSYDYSDKGYTRWFNGTSAAAPHVAGIAALILSEYPDLRQDMVRRSIEQGCAKLSGYSYSSDGKYPEEYKNNEVGYGLVKADYALSRAYLANIQNTLDNTAGLDFSIINSSSYPLEDVILDVRGTINGQEEYLISCDILNSIENGFQAGYPVYRGYSLSATPGTPITNIILDLYASCIDCVGNLEVGAVFDSPTPTSYSCFYFGSGDTCQLSLPDIVVPDGSRRRIYIRIFDVY